MFAFSGRAAMSAAVATSHVCPPDTCHGAALMRRTHCTLKTHVKKEWVISLRILKC